MELMEEGPVQNNLVFENQGSHPMLNRLVLSNVFEYLKIDKHTILKCRAVNPEWTECIAETKPVPLRMSLGRNVQALRRMLTNPNATLECKNLRIGYNQQDITDPMIISFLEEFGTEIRELAVFNPVTYLSTLIIFKECPHLVHLSFDPLKIRSLHRPQMCQSWDNFLPQLKSLTIDTSSDSFDKWRYALNINEGNALAIADLGLDVPFDFILHLLTQIPKIENFKVKNHYAVMWNKITHRLDQQPHLFHQLKNVHLHFYEVELAGMDPNDLWRPQLNIKVLEITNLKWEMAIPTILANVSGTLEKLTIQKSMTDDGSRRRRRHYLRFQNEMVALKEIVIVCTPKHIVECWGLGNRSVFNFLPKLQSFHTKTKRLGQREVRKELKMLKRGLKNMFSVRSRAHPNELFIRDGLTEICIDYILPSQVVQGIKRQFPQLRKLRVAVEGQVLQEVAMELCESKIQDLEVTYYETMEGIDEFASGITGLSISDCKRNGSKGGQAAIKKVRNSFGDWKTLRKLKISYQTSFDHFGYEPFVPLTNVCVEYGLAKMTQLHWMTLNGFEIHPMQVSNILNRVCHSLYILHLGGSKVNDWGLREDMNWDLRREANAAAVQGVRNKFPKVTLKLEWERDVD